MGLLDGKKALVTGARKGIGRGIAVRLAAEGADVGVNDIVDDDVTRQTAALARERGSEASVHIADVSRLPDIDAMIDAFLDVHGRIDILVNNAIFPDQSRSLFDTDEVYWDRMMNSVAEGLLLRGPTSGPGDGPAGRRRKYRLSFQRPRVSSVHGLDRVRCRQGRTAQDGEGTGRGPCRHGH